MIKLHNKKTRLSFGKHKGASVDFVLHNNPQYIIWCMNHVDGFGVSKDIKEFLEKITIRSNYPPNYYDDYGDEWGQEIDPWGTNFWS